MKNTAILIPFLGCVSLCIAGICNGIKNDCPDLPECDLYGNTANCSIEFPTGGSCRVTEDDDSITCYALGADEELLGAAGEHCPVCAGSGGGGGGDFDGPCCWGWGEGPGPWWM